MLTAKHSMVHVPSCVGKPVSRGMVQDAVEPTIGIERHDVHVLMLGPE